MWAWEIEFVRISTDEHIVISGRGYPTKEVANWMRGEWLKEFLPSFFLYKLVRSEIGEMKCGLGK